MDCISVAEFLTLGSKERSMTYFFLLTVNHQTPNDIKDTKYVLIEQQSPPGVLIFLTKGDPTP